MLKLNQKQRMKMETTIFIKASDEKIHEAFDATETNGYLLNIRRITSTDSKSVWQCLVRHNEKAKFRHFATYNLNDAQKIHYKSLSDNEKRQAKEDKPSVKNFVKLEDWE